MSDTPNLHAIEVRYLGPTNTKGSRVKLTSHRFEESVTIPYDHAQNSTADMAIEWLTSHGFEVVAKAEWLKSYVVLTDTFKGLKEAK